MVAGLRNSVRNMLGIRKERRLPRRSGKPPIGASIACDDLRFVVQAGFSDELWHWLMDRGWREVTYRPDRRRYREIPGTWVTRLIDAVPEARAQVLQVASDRASRKPNAAIPGALPSYVRTE